MIFPDRLRLPLRFDPELLRRDMALAVSAGWISHFIRQNYEGEWSIVPLRHIAGVRHPFQKILADHRATEFEDAPILSDCPYFREVIDAFRCPIRCVRLMRLAPGSVIKEHTDHELEFEMASVRIHIPIVTNPHVEFELNQEKIDLRPGEAWYLRLSDPHRVSNKGATERVHFVLDASVNKWVADLFDQALEECTPVPAFPVS